MTEYILQSKELEPVNVEYNAELQRLYLTQWDYIWEENKVNEIEIDIEQLEKFNAITTQILLIHKALTNK